LSPEIIKDIQASDILSKITECEFGTYLYGEFIPPDDNPLIHRTDISQCSYAPKVEWQKLVNLTNSFKEHFGYHLKSFQDE